MKTFRKTTKILQKSISKSHFFSYVFCPKFFISTTESSNIPPFIPENNINRNEDLNEKSKEKFNQEKIIEISNPNKIKKEPILNKNSESKEKLSGENAKKSFLESDPKIINEKTSEKADLTTKSQEKPPSGIIEKWFAVYDIQPEDDLPLQLMQKLNKSNYVENVLLLYYENINVFTANNKIVIIKRISKLFSKLMDDVTVLSENPQMIDFLNSIKESVSSMNAETLIHTLIFFRKMSDRKYFSKLLNREHIISIIERFKILVKNNQMTFNNACLFYYEGSYLRVNASYAIKFIDEVFKHKESKTHINAYYLTILMKTLNMTKDFKKSELFWKNLLFVIDYQTNTLKDVNLLAQFFTFLMELEFQGKLSKNLEIMSILKDNCTKLLNIFNKHTNLLLNFDLLNILKGYSNAPTWIDRILLEKIKPMILNNFQKSEFYDLSFRLKFLELMSKCSPEDQFDNKQAELLLHKILLSLNSNEMKDISSFYMVVKSIHLYKCPSKFKIYHYVYSRMVDARLGFVNIFSYLLILRKFLDDKFECDEAVHAVIDFYKGDFTGSFLERISLVWDVAFHPFLEKKSMIDQLRSDILSGFLTKTKEKINYGFKIIDIFGDRMKKIADKQIIIEFMNSFEKILSSEPHKFSVTDNLKMALFFTSEDIENDQFLKSVSKFRDLKLLHSNELEALLRFFRGKEVKNYKTLKILIQAVEFSEKKVIINNINLLLQIIMELPQNLIMNNTKGLINILNKIFGALSFDIDLKEIGLSYQAFLDLSEFLIKNGIFNFYQPAYFLAQDILKKKLIDELSLYKLSEIGFVIALSMKNNTYDIEKIQVVTIIDALRKIAGYLEVIVLDGENLKKDYNNDNSKNNDNLTNYKESVFLNRFLKIYYKGFKLDLKKKDPVFVTYCLEKLLLNFGKFYVNPDDQMKENVADIILTIIGLDIRKISSLNSNQRNIFNNILKVFLKPENFQFLYKHIPLHLIYFDETNDFDYKLLSLYVNYFNDLILLSQIPEDTIIYPFYFSNLFKFLSNFHSKSSAVLEKLFDEKQHDKYWNQLNSVQLFDITKVLFFMNYKEKKHMEYITQLILKKQKTFKPIQLSSIVTYYAQLGLNEKVFQDFIQNLLQDIPISKQTETNEMNYSSIEFLWALLFYEINNEQSITKLSKEFEKQYLKMRFQTIPPIKMQKINDIFNYINHIKNYSYIHFSSEFNELILKEILSRQSLAKSSKDMKIFLQEIKQEQIHNHFLLDTNFVNVYFPKKKIALLYVDHFSLSFHKNSVLGNHMMRRKILENISNEIKFIDVNMYELSTCSTKETKMKYLRGLVPDIF